MLVLSEFMDFIESGKVFEIPFSHISKYICAPRASVFELRLRRSIGNVISPGGCTYGVYPLWSSTDLENSLILSYRMRNFAQDISRSAMCQNELVYMNHIDNVDISFYASYALSKSVFDEQEDDEDEDE